jgi:hypothetical protein
VTGVVRRLGGGRRHREQVVTVPGADDVEQVAGSQPREAHLDLARRGGREHDALWRLVVAARVD